MVANNFFPNKSIDINTDDTLTAIDMIQWWSVFFHIFFCCSFFRRMCIYVYMWVKKIESQKTDLFHSLNASHGKWLHCVYAYVNVMKSIQSIESIAAADIKLFFKSTETDGIISCEVTHAALTTGCKYLNWNFSLLIIWFWPFVALLF